MGKGKLLFKGDKAKSKKKKKKTKYSSLLSADNNGAILASTSQHHSGLVTSTASSQASSSTTQINEQSPPAGPSIRKGKGKLTSSGTVLFGHETNFNSCLNPGDAILVNILSEDGSSSKEEMRVVNIRLSDTSASISSSFSQDLSHPTSFQYIAKPKNVQKEKDDKEKKERLSKEEIERSAFGTYKSGGGDGHTKELVYRERTEQGNYRIRRERVDADSTRSNLLDMRTQKKADKYC